MKIRVNCEKACEVERGSEGILSGVAALLECGAHGRVSDVLEFVQDVLVALVHQWDEQLQRTGSASHTPLRA